MVLATFLAWSHPALRAFMVLVSVFNRIRC
jgi:hypothetical protein